MTVTHKVVVKMSPTARLELHKLVSRLSREYNDSHGRVTQSSAVEAALYYWLRKATLDEQRASFRETSGEQTTAVTFQLTNESDLRAACGGDLAIERIRAGFSYPSHKDTLRAVIKCVNRRAIVTLYRGNRRPILTPRKLIDSTHLVVWTDGVTGDVDSGDDCADPSGSSGSRGADQTDCP